MNEYSGHSRERESVCVCVCARGYIVCSDIEKGTTHCEHDKKNSLQSSLIAPRTANYPNTPEALGHVCVRVCTFGRSD